MFGIKVEEIIQRIKEDKALSNEEIEGRINSKINDLSGLISREGAARIIANELGVKLFDANKKRYKIKEIYNGLRGVELLGKVTFLNEIRNFNVKDRNGKVRSFFVGDETGQTRVVLWNDQVDKYLIKENDIVLVKDSFIKENSFGYKEIHLGNSGLLEINPNGETVEQIKPFERSINKPASSRLKISELQENNNARVYGTIVQVFEPRFYMTCPNCNKKINDGICEAHGTVIGKPAIVLNMFLDDGSGSIRITAFRETAYRILEIDDKKLQTLKDNPVLFEDLKKNLMGKQLVVEGKVTKNQMFDRLEFIANRVEDADPEKLIEEINI